MTNTTIKTGLLIFALAGGICACAEVKDAGKTVGHATRDVSREIGHATRDATKDVVKGTRRVVKEATADPAE